MAGSSHRRSATRWKDDETKAQACGRGFGTGLSGRVGRDTDGLRRATGKKGSIWAVARWPPPLTVRSVRLQHSHSIVSPATFRPTECPRLSKLELGYERVLPSGKAFSMLQKSFWCWQCCLVGGASRRANLTDKYSYSEGGCCRWPKRSSSCGGLPRSQIERSQWKTTNQNPANRPILRCSHQLAKARLNALGTDMT